MGVAALLCRLSEDGQRDRCRAHVHYLEMHPLEPARGRKNGAAGRIINLVCVVVVFVVAVVLLFLAVVVLLQFSIAVFKRGLAVRRLPWSDKLPLGRRGRRRRRRALLLRVVAALA
jgi:hypothetical protein